MFGKRKLTDAVAFVDYEHWFYGYMNQFQMKPNVEQWIAELKQDFKIKAFGAQAFLGPTMGSQMIMNS